MKRIIPILSVLLLLAAPSHFALAQGRTITGKVTQAEDNSPLPGVSVVVKGTSTGAITNAEGQYSLGVPNNATLVFSFVGFTTQEVAAANQTVVNVQLQSQVTNLTEVVVTGYTSQQRKDILGSVATVFSSQYRTQPVASIDQALQGRAAGVLVQQSSGTPGGGINVRVRGTNSIGASNRPLFIIDGVRVEEGQLGIRDFGGQTDNPLSTINPNDIESMSIVKDAAAKAIYGAAGSNGVVIITTKRGKNGRTEISGDAQYGTIDLVKKLDLLNATELLELQREAVINAGDNPDARGLIPGVTDAVNTDWVDQVTRRAMYQQYQVSARGGNERTAFYVSGSYRDEEGVLLNNRLTRYSGVINLDQKASQKLSFGANLTIGWTKNQRVKGDNFLDGVYSGAVKSLPYYHPYDEQGRLIGPASPEYPAFPNFNPVAQAVLPRFDTYATKIIGGLYGEYTILADLKFRSKISIDYNNVTEDQFESSQTAIGGYLPSVGGKGYGVYNTGIYATIINTNLLTFNRTFAEKHSFNTLLGQEVLRRVERSSSVNGRLFPSDDFTYVTSAGIVDAGSSDLGQNGQFSVFSELRYSYADKYLLNFTSRYDGSSRFGPQRRFGYFPAVSAGWRISSEPFMEQFNTFLDDLKLRASYGLTGNERFDDFGFLSTFSSVPYNGSSGTSPVGPGNPLLQWESTRGANIGLDATLFNGRISFTGEVYDNLTSKLLFLEPLPLTTGFGGVTGNVGKVSNKGIELTLSTVNLDGAVRWSTDLNWSRNINQVEELITDERQFRGYQASGIDRTNIVVPGQPIGTFWGLRFLGVDPATGDAIYDDINYDGQISSEDGTVIGNAQPKFYGGVANRLSWKGFDLNVFFQYSYGNSILNFSNSALLDAGEDLNNNQVRQALKRWRKPGDVTSVPRYVAGNTYNNYHSSRFIEDGSYLRLKNIALSYNIPASLLSRYKIVNSVRVYASATNLWTLTRYSGSDPEVSTLDGSTTAQGIDFFTLPPVRTLMVGVTVGL